MLPVENVLQSAGLSNGLKPEYIKKIAALSEVQRFAKDETIIREDARDRDLFS